MVTVCVPEGAAVTKVSATGVAVTVSVFCDFVVATTAARVATPRPARGKRPKAPAPMVAAVEAAAVVAAAEVAAAVAAVGAAVTAPEALTVAKSMMPV